MAIKGCGANFLLGANTVAGLTNISNPYTAESLDVTTFDSDCVREFLAGLRSGTISVSGYYEDGDTNGQVVLRTAMYAGTTLTGASLPKILWDGTNGISADAIVTSMTTEAAVDGLVSFTADLQLSGAVTVI